MAHGRIVQVGTPREIYEAPANRFVADFIGDGEMFDGRVAGIERAAAACCCAEAGAVVHGRARARSPPAPMSPSPCGRRRSPLEAPPADAGRTALAGRVADIAYLGEASSYRDRARDRPAAARRRCPTRGARTSGRSACGRRGLASPATRRLRRVAGAMSERVPRAGAVADRAALCRGSRCSSSCRS